MIQNEKLKTRIKESITNLSNLGVIPADEAQLNIDVLYNSVLDKVCSIVPMESPRQIISCLKLIYDSKNKSMTEDKDVFKMALMNGVTVPLDDNGYPTNKVKCSIIPDTEGVFLAHYQKIIPGSVSINNGAIIDNGFNKLINADNAVKGTIDYEHGVFNITGLDDKSVVEYEFDIYNLMTNENKIKFVKHFIEVFAELYQLDANVAISLMDMKSLDIQKNIETILPQILTQQIDQYILHKYFELATRPAHNVGSWSSDVDWDSKTRVPVHLLYSDLGAYISVKSAEYAKKNGVVPNVILVNPLGYGILSTSEKFQPVVIAGEEDEITGTPKTVGYYNNARVILTNVIDDNLVDVVLTYKGPSEAQTAGVFAPYIPVTLRSVKGIEGGGMTITNNIYSMNGFAMVNPDLVEGIKIV